MAQEELAFVSSPIEAVSVITEELPISSISPYDKNSRNHPEHQITALVSAIKRFGFTQPLIIDESNTVLAGHGRLSAAKKLKLKTVPCRVVKGLTADEKRAYVIADNKIAEQSSWDNDTLLSELSHLAELDLGEDLNSLLDQTTFTQIKVEQIALRKLKPHPKNYKTHPEAQLEHLKKSIAEHGIYRNVIVANDYTILAGHGVVEAAKSLGLQSVPCLHTDLNPDSVKAIKLLTADNEISHIADSNARELTDLLKQVLIEDDLLGTGYDKEKLEALLMVSRSKDEVQNIDDTEFADLDFEALQDVIKVTVSFEDEKDRSDFFTTLGIEHTEKTKAIWWPIKDREQNSHLIITKEEL